MAEIERLAGTILQTVTGTCYVPLCGYVTVALTDQYMIGYRAGVKAVGVSSSKLISVRSLVARVGITCTDGDGSIKDTEQQGQYEHSIQT